MAGGKERRPDDRGTDSPRRFRVPGSRGPEQVRLVAEPEHPVVVHEIDVAIERERTKIGEVIEAVALQPRAELQLQRQPGDEERREDESCPWPAADRKGVV